MFVFVWCGEIAAYKSHLEFLCKPAGEESKRLICQKYLAFWQMMETAGKLMMCLIQLSPLASADGCLEMFLE